MNLIHLIQLIIRTVRIRLICPFMNIRMASGACDISLDTRIYGRNGYVSLGKRVKTSRNVTLVAVDGSVDVGDDCSFSGGSTVVAHERIIIENRCMFGPGVKIYDHDHLYDERGVLAEGYKTAAVRIGEKSWIGANSVILKGTDIGEGCIIGAGTVVKGIIPPHSIVTNSRELIIRPIRREE